MKLMNKGGLIACIIGVSALTLSACSAPYGRQSGMKTNHFRSPFVKPMVGPSGNGRYAAQQKRPNSRISPVPMPQFQQWVEYEPQYTLYPGDQVDIVVSSAPELSRTLTVGPDGRIVMPMIQPVMAAGRTFAEVQNMISAQLATQLRDPRISVTPRAYAPAQVFVGGEVGAQGTYPLPGPIGATEAIMMAGGLTATARSSRVAVLRRAPNGGMMLRTVNISKGMKNIAQYNDVLQLRRGDIVFVPKTDLAEIASWMQTFRSALPVDISLSYQLGNSNGLTPIISP